MTSLRTVLRLLIGVLLPALIVSSTATGKTPAQKQYLAYVGTYTAGDSKGIYAYRYDAASGQMTSLGLAAETSNPSFLTAAAGGDYLYAVNEDKDFQDQSSGAVSAFTIDRTTGRLKLLNQVASRGADPCYLALDRSGKFLLVANYTGGNLAVFPVLAGGKLGAASAFVQHQGSRPNTGRQEHAHAHWIATSPDNRFALAADLGADKIFIYRFDSKKGTLLPNQHPFVQVKPGQGPRHLAFHPDGKFVYLLSELDSSVTSFAYDSQNGTLRELQNLPTLPIDFSGENTAAEIAVHPSGKFLYTSNRGHNSIAVFSIDADKGTLTFIDWTSSQGKTPRNFQIDPSGKRLFVANQESDNIVAFAIDPSSGRLTATGEKIKVPAPVCIKFVAVD